MPSRRALLAACAAALSIAALACTKSESGGAEQGESASAAASTAPPASAATSAESATADSAATPKSSPPAVGPGDADAAAAASGDAAPVECGTKPLPDCPLQAWMKAHANPPVMQNDLPALAAALDEIVRFAPPGYTNWESIAKDGAAAARSGDMAAAKASCRSCHDQYKQRYKTEMRARKI